MISTQCTAGTITDATRGGGRRRPGGYRGCVGGQRPARGEGVRGSVKDTGRGPQGEAPGGNLKEKTVIHWWLKVVQLIQLDFA